MKLDGANNTDVREELAALLLAALGYERGTQNDILREFNISYDRIFLGRRKPTDPPLRGRADDVLSVAGAARWGLEVKAPSEELGRDAVDQPISYARHPEVGGTYAALLNGRLFVVYYSSQTSGDKPTVILDVDTMEDLAENLRGLPGRTFPGRRASIREAINDSPHSKLLG